MNNINNNQNIVIIRNLEHMEVVWGYGNIGIWCHGDLKI